MPELLRPVGADLDEGSFAGRRRAISTGTSGAVLASPRLQKCLRHSNSLQRTNTLPQLAGLMGGRMGRRHQFGRSRCDKVAALIDVTHASTRLILRLSLSNQKSLLHYALISSSFP